MLKKMLCVITALALCTAIAPTTMASEKEIISTWERIDNILATCDINGVSLILPKSSPALPMQVKIPSRIKSIKIIGQTDYKDLSITSNSSVKLVIENLSFSAPDRIAGIELAKGSTLILAGKNFITGGYQCAAISVPRGKSLVIEGNGELVAQAGADGAGIGGNVLTSAGEIIIRGGKISATGLGGAGIGGGKGYDYEKSEIPGARDMVCTTGGKIVISGGFIEAIGEYSAAGIGGGSWGTVGIIIINGGEIIAKSIEEYPVNGIAEEWEVPIDTFGRGAGIGDGAPGNIKGKKGSITINGGSVIAKSVFAPGIGCEGQIRINGGTIQASSELESGIGCYRDGKAVDIRISGGNVDCYSAYDIGLGSSEVKTNITITGNANVRVYAHDDAICTPNIYGSSGYFKVLSRSAYVTATSNMGYAINAKRIVNNGNVELYASSNDLFYNVKPQGKGKLICEVKDFEE